MAQAKKAFVVFSSSLRTPLDFLEALEIYSINSFSVATFMFTYHHNLQSSGFRPDILKEVFMFIITKTTSHVT